MFGQKVIPNEIKKNGHGDREKVGNIFFPTDDRK